MRSDETDIANSGRSPPPETVFFFSLKFELLSFPSFRTPRTTLIKELEMTGDPQENSLFGITPGQRR